MASGIAEAPASLDWGRPSNSATSTATQVPSRASTRTGSTAPMTAIAARRWASRNPAACGRYRSARRSGGLAGKVTQRRGRPGQRGPGTATLEMLVRIAVALLPDLAGPCRFRSREMTCHEINELSRPAPADRGEPRRFPGCRWRADRRSSHWPSPGQVRRSRRRRRTPAVRPRAGGGGVALHPRRGLLSLLAGLAAEVRLGQCLLCRRRPC